MRFVARWSRLKTKDFNRRVFNALPGGRFFVHNSLILQEKKLFADSKALKRKSLILL